MSRFIILLVLCGCQPSIAMIEAKLNFDAYTVTLVESEECGKCHSAYSNCMFDTLGSAEMQVGDRDPIDMVNQCRSTSDKCTLDNHCENKE